MHEIKENRKMVHGQEVTTFEREIYNCNVLSVEAGTNGYHGGDTGHGSRTYICIRDEAGTDIHARPLGKYGDEGVEIMLGGDAELETMIKALEFITKVLKDQAAEVYD